MRYGTPIIVLNRISLNILKDMDYDLSYIKNEFIFFTLRIISLIIHACDTFT